MHARREKSSCHLFIETVSPYRWCENQINLYWNFRSLRISWYNHQICDNFKLINHPQNIFKTDLSSPQMSLRCSLEINWLMCWNFPTAVKPFHPTGLFLSFNVFRGCRKRPWHKICLSINPLSASIALIWKPVN